MRGSTRRVKRRPGGREGYFGLIHQNFSHATRVRFVTYSLVLTTLSSHPCVIWEHSHNQFGNYLLLSIIFTLVRTHAPIREHSHHLLTLYIYQMLSLNSVTCEHAFFLPSRTRISTLKPHTSREKKKIEKPYAGHQFRYLWHSWLPNTGIFLITTTLKRGVSVSHGTWHTLIAREELALRLPQNSDEQGGVYL